MSQVAAEDYNDVVGYITDVEGNLDYFLEYVKISKVVTLKEDKTNGFVLNTPGKKEVLDFYNSSAKLVFGGDSQDKGVGDVRIVLLLLEFKKRFPDRVHLIIGNRDCNKLRLAAELSAAILEDEEVANDKGFPYWVAPEKRVTPNMALEKDPKTGNKGADRLKWMLKHTMGADGGFERRKFELAEMQDKNMSEISDDDVVTSYRDSIDATQKDWKKCFMLEYLRNAELGYFFGNTLFVHGGVSKDNWLRIPGETEASGVKDWINKLNSFAKQQVAEFEKETDHPKSKNKTDRKGHKLMDYGVPNGNCEPAFDPAAPPRTVICNTHLVGGNPAQFDMTLADALVKEDTFNVVVGHIPHGDCPTTIRAKKVLVIMGDTSYSKMGYKTTKKTSSGTAADTLEYADNRNGAVSEIIVWPNGKVQVHGVRSTPDTGAADEIDFFLRHDNGDKYVGRQVKDGDMKAYWVKAKIKGEDKYVLSKGEGFKLDHKTLTLADLEKLEFEEATVVPTADADPPADLVQGVVQGVG
eukprot:CAMPEP_0181308944 /NCGR_PEP_ID=MMETSP1101-20121128/11750_1 /TAXON_ID=46948 /ORGANISM="Rhodomonas abbreviata, Strain Caron Lab Isolate" /LENGTH=523 /DNA_ID=CAMNT_0023415395 /DNA_START=24 /DNA_END=1592 /DNA_ORIENTATION=+